MPGARDMGTAVFKAIADFAQVRREARQTRDDLERLRREAERPVRTPEIEKHLARDFLAGKLQGAAFAKGFASGVGKLSVGAPIVGGVGALALGGAASALTLTASLSSLAGVGAAVPGVLGGIAIASGVLKSSLGDVADHLGDLQAPLQNMQKSMSGEFWYWAEKPLRSLAQKLLPDAQDGLENIARGWGQVVAEGSKAAEGAFGGGRLSRILESTKQGVDALKPAMAPAVNAFAQLAEFGAGKIPALGTAVSNLAQKWAAWVTDGLATGKIQAWFDAGMAGLRDLGKIAGSVMDMFGALVKAAQLSGANSTLSTLADGFRRVADMMNAPGFQIALATIFSGASKGAEGLLSALGPLGTMFQNIAPQLGTFFTLAGEVLGTLLTAIAQALGNGALMTGLNAFMSGLLLGVQLLAPVLPVLATALGAILTALAPVIAALTPSLGATITVLATAFAALVTAVAPLVVALAPLLPILVPLALAAMAVAKGFLLFQQVKGVIELIKGLTAVQWLWNAALAANPIMLIIIAIVALVAALIWFFTQTDIGREIWGGFVNWLGEIIGGFLNWWNGTVVPWFTTMFAAAGVAIDMFFAQWNGFWTGVWNVVVMIWNMIVAWFAQQVANTFAILGGLAALAGMALNWFMGLVNGALTAGGQLLAYVAGIPGQVLGFLGNLGSLLLGAGQSLIQGFIDGISSMIGAVGSAVGGVMDAIAGFFPHSPAKVGPFSGKGWTPYRGKTVMTGFAEGLKAGQVDAELAANEGMVAISNRLDPTINGAGLLGGPPPGLGGPPPAPAGGSVPPLPPPSPTAGGLNVTVNNPIPEPPSQSVQKTYSKIAYLGLDAEEAHV